MFEKSIEKIVSDTMPNPNLANGIPKYELCLFFNKITKTFKKTIKLGAKEINLPKIEMEMILLALYVTRLNKNNKYVRIKIRNR